MKNLFNKNLIFGISLIVIVIALAFLTNVKGHSEESQVEDLDFSEMDKDNDGICDFCGMNVEDCEEMMEHHSNNMYDHMGMHSMHDDLEEDNHMGCHVKD